MAVSTLCTHCQKIFESDVELLRGGNDSRPLAHHPSIRSLLEAAIDCHFCTIISSSIIFLSKPLDEGFLDAPTTWSLAGLKRPYDHDPKIRIFCDYSPLTSTEYRKIAEFDLTREENFDDPTLSGDGWGDSTGSPNNLKLAKSWLIECASTHSGCGANLDTILPTRLLDLGDIATHSDLSGVRLVDSRNLEPGTEYATLSHCWGRKTSLELLNENIDSLSKNIPESGLCQTFIDSIITAKALGIGYLWIDRLCIIQHDEEDWSKEAAMMGNVYSNALLNISATAARDGDEGCFSKRSPLLPQKCTVSPTWRGFPEPWTGSYEIHNRSSIGIHHAFIIKAPIDSRAWVVQERFLSRRTLHFCHQRMIWDCCEKKFCDLAVEEDMSRYNGEPVKSWKHFTDSKSKNAAYVYKSWCELVERYTSCNLTNMRDKLPALLGIINDFEAILGRNIAGLWKSQIHHQLLWTSAVYDSFPHRSADYRAPSWSWVSLDGKISYFNGSLNHDITSTTLVLADIIQIPLDIPWQTNTPRVEDGAMTIKGQMINVEIDLSTNASECFSKVNGKKFTKPGSIKGHGSPDEKGPAGKETVYCLPILVDSLRFEHHVKGLLLRLSDKRGFFARIGYFSMDSRNFDALLKEFLDEGEYLPLPCAGSPESTEFTYTYHTMQERTHPHCYVSPIYGKGTTTWMMNRYQISII